MKEKRKEHEAQENEDCYIEHLSSPSYLQCKKHPPSPTDGICAQCLRDKLLALLCPRCEELLCSCSMISSSRSSATSEVGSVGKISFLIDNEIDNEIAEALQPISKPKPQKKATAGCEKTETHLRRSNSSDSLDVKRQRKRSFWELVKVLGRRKSEKGEDKCEISVPDFISLPRSRSASSFRGGSFYDPYQESGRFAVSSVSRVTSFGAGFVLEPARRSCFSESEARISNFGRENASVGFSWTKESRFSCEDPRFIDLKLDLSSKTKPEISALKRCGSSGGARRLELLGSELGGSFGMMRGGNASHRESFTIDVKKCTKKHRMWRWFLKR